MDLSLFREMSLGSKYCHWRRLLIHGLLIGSHSLFQKRMSNARVLYVNLTGVTCEIMKNLVLAGVAAVICDDREYPEAVRSVPASFFPAKDMEEIMEKSTSVTVGEPDAKKAKKTRTVAAAVQPKVEGLNPLLVRNGIEERSIDSIPDDYFKGFDAVVASRLSVEQATRISKALRSDESKLFIMTDTFGLDGAAHLDFGKGHCFRREIGKDKLSELTKIEPYISMEEMLAVDLSKVKGRWDKSIPSTLVKQRLLMDYWAGNDKQSFPAMAESWLEAHNLPKGMFDVEDLGSIAKDPEISPVCAVLGGILGNEVIKALTGKGEPANNTLLFDGLDGGCRSFLLKGD